MKYLSLLAVTTAAIFVQGCAEILPGNDPVVVDAERTTTTAYATFDSFLQIEYLNRPLIMKYAPQVHTYAEYVRHNGLKWLTTARALTRAYKDNRNAQNKANLATAIAILNSASLQAGSYLTQAQNTVAAPPAPTATPASTVSQGP